MIKAYHTLLYVGLEEKPINPLPFCLFAFCTSNQYQLFTLRQKLLMLVVKSSDLYSIISNVKGKS